MAAVTTAIARQVHDPDDEEDRRQAGTGVAAVETEAQAVSQGRPCVRGNFRPRPVPAGSRQGCAFQV